MLVCLQVSGDWFEEGNALLQPSLYGLGSDHTCWTLTFSKRLLAVLLFSVVDMFSLGQKVAWVTPLSLCSRHQPDLGFFWTTNIQ